MHMSLLMVCVLVAGLSQGGCSVVMALSGEPDPDFLAMTAGTSRLSVESELGTPVEQKVQEDGGVECTYEYASGNEPNIGRAAIHGAFDALTFGAWELAGVGIESAVDEKNRAAVVVYDQADRLVSVRHRDIEQ